jgi:hypothetical protein
MVFVNTLFLMVFQHVCHKEMQTILYYFIEFRYLDWHYINSFSICCFNEIYRHMKETRMMYTPSEQGNRWSFTLRWLSYASGNLMYWGKEKLNATRKLNPGGVTRRAYYCMPWKSKKVGLKCQVCKRLGLPHGSEPSFCKSVTSCFCIHRHVPFSADLFVIYFRTIGDFLNWHWFVCTFFETGVRQIMFCI